VKGEPAAPPTTVSVGATSFDLPPPPPFSMLDKPPVVSPPRPAIEFLPPIIVQEKEDDGASLLNLPLDVPFHESTLVLSGRKRAQRWVPLNAAVAAAVGAACLASALTAVVVKARPQPARIVERRILVSPPPTAAVAVVEAPRPTATTEPPAAKPPNDPATIAPAPVVERKSDSGGSGKPREGWRREDPGALDAPAASTARRELRAGFPTSPGF
jgi:hypothetical protein